MRIGFKLDVDFDTSVAHQRLFGEGIVPVALKELGVESVEFPLGLSRCPLRREGLCSLRC